MAQEGSRRSEGVRRRRPFVVAYNALHVRPGVYDGAATFSLNVVQQLPEVLPEARIVAYVAEGEDRLEPRPNLELRPVGEGRVHAPGRLALETLWLTVDLRRIGASALISPHESIPLRPSAPVVVVAQNLVYHRHGLDDAFVGRERRERLRSNLSARYYRRRMAETYAKAAAVVAVSGHTADMLVEHSQLDRSKTVVVHEGSDSMFLGNPEVPETRQPRLLAVSTLAPYKNLEAAIDVLARLRPQRPELVLDVAGSDWRGFQRELEEYAASRGVGDAVNFLGLSGRQSSRDCMRVRCCFCTCPSASRSACRSSRRCASGCRWSQRTAPRCRRSPAVPRPWRTRTTSAGWRRQWRPCSPAAPPSSSGAATPVPPS